VKYARRKRGSLLILLFATFLGSSACVTPSQPTPEASEMEASQDQDLVDESAVAEGDLENTGEDEALLEDESEITPQEPAPMPAEPQTVGAMDQDLGVVSGIAGKAMDQGLPEDGSKMSYIVQKGDTLSKIAKRIFSNQARWRDLAVASSLKNPNRIFPGDVIYYQLDTVSVAFAKKYESIERQETTVQPGENLSQLSKRVYGDKEQWKFLWRLNDQISDPSDLTVGSVVYYVHPRALSNLDDQDYTASNTMNKVYKSKQKKEKV